MGRYLKGERKQQCNDTWERRGQGMRYVYDRGRCKRWTWHPSGYCSVHRYSYRWTQEQEGAARKQDGEGK